MFLKKNVLRGISYISVMMIFIGHTAGIALETNRNMVDTFLGTKSYEVVTEGEGEELYTAYKADYNNTDELVNAHKDMGKRLLEEGAVLLKNSDALPLSSEEKNVTLLGLRAEAKTIYGATIGVSVPAEQNVSLSTALTEKGFSVNQEVNNAYMSMAQKDEYSKNVNKVNASFSGVEVSGEQAYVAAEPSVSELKEANSKFESSLKDYSDAAIVVVGRPGTEAGDYYPGATGIDPAQGARNALALTDSEREIINYAKENFEKVVVLLNSANTMEIEELKQDEAIDAIMWIGLVGNYGMRGVADILSGDVNPSGALPDLYATDTTSCPAMANYGVMAWNNAKEYLDTQKDRADYYIMEAEGIYTGYRYYETRYADCVMDRGNAKSTVGAFDSEGNWNYGQEVSYAFGYGLSYTTFEQQLNSIDVSMENQTVKADISIKNTGDMAGKTSVQLYAQAPYTEGGVEKSAVVLLDYAKTDIIQPGESTEIEIVADLKNLTSYDDKNAKTFILDEGDYYFTLGNGSHEAVNNILAAQGYTVEAGMDNNGNAQNVQIWNYVNESNTNIFAKSKSGVEITNHLQNADYNTWNPDTITYLSRSNWEATWPASYTDLSLTEDMLLYLKNDFYEIATGDKTSDMLGQKGNLSFSDMKNVAYDDPKWDELLSQLDLQEAIMFITQGNRNYASMESVGFVGGQYTENAPNGFCTALSAYSDKNSPWFVAEDDKNAQYSTNDMGSAPLLAATFNKDFAYEYGVLWGNDSLFNGLPILWGPGLNLHRTQYNGRNCEYYSEDPILAGYTGVSLIQGGLTKGLIMAPKHFAFNDQEANRNGVAPFMEEQKARELELRSFQIAVEGGTLGLMTSFSRIGPVYVGACSDLITDILYNEWGYNGYVVSDMVNPASYMTWKESVIAGTTNFDTTEVSELWADYITATTNQLSGDAAMVEAIKQRVHNTLYVFAQSNLMNSVNSSSKKVELNVWWRVAYKSVYYVAIILTILCVAGYVAVCLSERRKEEKR